MILGAGYDTRAERLGCLAGCEVIEVDHANTQARKRGTIAAADLATPQAVTYVAVDFEHDDLAEALIDAGPAPGGRTMSLWEGVTQYLSAGAVDRTLAALLTAARTGDVLMFTYVDEAALGAQQQERFPEAARWLRGTRRRGEPWVFGLAPSQLAGYLEARGFGLLGDVSTREAGDRYFVPRRRPERGSDLYRVATATAN